VKTSELGTPTGLQLVTNPKILIVYSLFPIVRVIGGGEKLHGNMKAKCSTKTLLHVKVVGNDLKFNSGRCRKAGQFVSVSDGSPHLLVAEATAGGAG